ncbi:helix-turn-helix domain-containing protein [Amycolatopsis sp. H20-H5]|uniref:helix-turn-helix domain-containing protein n=1 Tax=Amycolatopsis sp. H20-H5 TaxID=3046309 RepID=UPI002DC031FA|nr:helix-turn-helix transcriptional regulator [Amycolatopsis sp. H20-H5]MEC3980122.1 helix-turn-helix transcriptional regulator [Amycolatopsis sp. H20-H5]
MTEESTARRRVLGSELRASRKARRFTGSELARRADVPQSQVSRWENGFREMSTIEAAIYLASCGTIGPERDRLLALTRPPSDLYWVQPYFDRLVDPMKSLIIQENLASSIIKFEPVVIPGLIQIEPYARALFEDDGRHASNRIDFLVAARLNRQKLLHRKEPPHCTFFVHERALRSVVNGPETMHGQVLHLLLCDNLPHCAVRVVPESSRVHRTLGTAFAIMDFADQPAVVMADSYAAMLFIDDRVAVDAYSLLAERLGRAALGEAQSREMLSRLAGEYQRMED